MKGFKNIQPRLKIEPIAIKEPYKADIKEFTDTEEFTRYFRENEDAFKEPSNDPEKPVKFLTANKLNRTYKIPGYRIRIIRKGTDNEELTLVKDYHGRLAESNSNEELDNSNRTVVEERITQMEELVQRLSDQVNNIETFLLQLKR